LPEILDNGRATETQADSQSITSGMVGIRINTTGQRFRGFSEFGVDATQALFVQEDAGSIILVSQSVATVSNLLNDGSLHGDPVTDLPALLFDTTFLFFRDFDQVFTTATATIVTAPVLNHGKF
jgi:hypothetical protein